MVTVISGSAALRSGQYWIGVIEGDIYCSERRLTPEKALDDAEKLLKRSVK